MLIRLSCRPCRRPKLGKRGRTPRRLVYGAIFLNVLDGWRELNEKARFALELGFFDAGGCATVGELRTNESAVRGRCWWPDASDCLSEYTACRSKPCEWHRWLCQRPDGNGGND